MRIQRRFQQRRRMSESNLVDSSAELIFSEREVEGATTEGAAGSVSRRPLRCGIGPVLV